MYENIIGTNPNEIAIQVEALLPQEDGSYRPCPAIIFRSENMEVIEEKQSQLEAILGVGKVRLVRF